MKFKYKIVLILFLLSQTTFGGDWGKSTKITSRAKTAFSQSNSFDTHRLWLYLDSTTVNKTIVALSEKALIRRGKVDPNNFLVDNYDYSIAPIYVSEIKKSGIKVRRVSRWLKAVSVEATTEQAEEIVKHKFVKKIDLVKTLTASVEDIVSKETSFVRPDKTTAFDYGGSLKNAEFSKVIKLHQAGLTGRGVTLALFDSGFNIDHLAFIDSINIAGKYDFINNDTSVSETGCDDNSESQQQDYHGTLVMGVIAGFVPGEYVGLAPNVSLLLAKTEITCDNTEIKVEEDNWIAAAEWADVQGADIISSSVGYTIFSDITDSEDYTIDDLDGNTALITIAADIAASKNILVVTGAGNERATSWEKITFPADGDSVITVGGVNSDSTAAFFSSIGPTADGRIKPDIVSLATGVLSTRSVGGYINVQGVSFSTPMIAAGSALAMEHNPLLTAEEMRNLIRATGDRADNPDNVYGYGLYDAARAADIIKFNSEYSLRVLPNTVALLHVETSGSSPDIPVITAFNHPAEAEIIDSANGRGLLIYNAVSSESIQTTIGLVADVGYFAETTFVEVTVSADNSEAIFAYPNPFSESINISLNPTAGNLVSITVFNIAGEKVWKKVNESSPSADIWHWDGTNLRGEELSDGPYILLVKTKNAVKHLKVLKIR